MSTENPSVRAFKNHRLGCYTILRGQQVVASARRLRLEDVTFEIRASGRRRMLETGQRTLHAYARGQLVDYVTLADADRLAPIVGRRADYDPRQGAFFFELESGEPIVGARFAQLDESGLWVSEPRYLEPARAA